MLQHTPGLLVPDARLQDMEIQLRTEHKTTRQNTNLCRFCLSSLLSHQLTWRTSNNTVIIMAWAIHDAYLFLQLPRKRDLTLLDWRVEVGGHLPTCTKYRGPVRTAVMGNGGQSQTDNLKKSTLHLIIDMFHIGRLRTVQSGNHLLDNPTDITKPTPETCQNKSQHELHPIHQRVSSNHAHPFVTSVIIYIVRRAHCTSPTSITNSPRQKSKDTIPGTPGP